jgi:hypothetical protein
MCPRDLDVNPNHELRNKPAAWQVFIHPDRYRFLLEGVDFYFGAPKNLAQIKLPSSRDDRSVTWKRNGADDKGPYWIVCHYMDTSINLAREIPASINQCVVRYNPGATVAGYPDIESVDCR